MKSSQKLTQAQRILKAFRENNNTLTLPQMLDLHIAQYNTRIFELKKKGYVIENEYLGTFDGVKHTRFVLRQEPRKYSPKPSEAPKGFPSRSHQIAHEIRMEKEKDTPQLTLNI